MDISDLETFRSVVEHGGVSAAAREMHRVQSSISARLSGLERGLGCALFERRGKRLALTPEGRHLYERSGAIVGDVQRLRRELALRAPGAMLRIGSMESTAAVRLAPALARLRREQPRMQLSVRTGTTGALLEALQRCEIDAAFVAGAREGEGLEWQPAFVEVLVMIVPRQAHDAETLVTFNAGCAYREVAQAWARERNFPLERAVEIGSYHAMVAAVSAGMGVGLVPRSVLQRCDTSALRVRRLGPPYERQTTWLATRTSSDSAAIAALQAAIAA